MLVPPAWSLSVELLFYLSAPLLVRRSVRVQLAVIAATFAMRIAALSMFHLPVSPWNSHFFPFEAGLFLLGSVAFRALPAAGRVTTRTPALRWVLTAGLLLLVFCYDRIPLGQEPRRWAFLACVLFSVPLLFAASGRDRVDRWIGEMSYPLYLMHQVTFFAAEPIMRRIGGLGADIAVFALPLAVAALVYALIERPFEAWRARRFERTLARAEQG
jgi:peptidoglycan/LPS O-acetylase OafA/YrhL